MSEPATEIAKPKQIAKLAADIIRAMQRIPTMFNELGSFVEKEAEWLEAEGFEHASEDDADWIEEWKIFRSKLEIWLEEDDKKIDAEELAFDLEALVGSKPIGFLYSSEDHFEFDKFVKKTLEAAGYAIEFMPVLVEFNGSIELEETWQCDSSVYPFSNFHIEAAQGAWKGSKEKRKAEEKKAEEIRFVGRSDDIFAWKEKLTEVDSEENRDGEHEVGYIAYAMICRPKSAEKETEQQLKKQKK